MRYLAIRCVQGTILLLGVSLLSFVFLELSPGDFFEELRLNPQVSQNSVQKLRSQYGMDQPLVVRYGRWITSALRGEFGLSLAYGTPVAPLLWARARNTLLLTTPAMLLTWAIALPLGVACAARPGGWLDHATSLLTSTLLAIPELLLALLFLAFAVRTGWFHAGGMVSGDLDGTSKLEQLRSLCSHIVLPVLVLTLGSLPVLLRHVRTAISEVLNSPYIRAAQANGIPLWRVLCCHVLPAAANPLVSLLGFSIASLLSISLVTEVIMNWPGLGPLLLEAILARDIYVVIGAILCSTLLLLASTFLADLLLFAMDPRIRTERLA